MKKINYMLEYTMMYMKKTEEKITYRCEEIFAKLILEYAFPEEFSNLQLSDKPDLQDKVLDIGIEVTTAIPPENHELDVLYNNLVTGKVNSAQNVSKKIKNLKGKIDKNGILYHPTYHRNLNYIKNAIEIKLKKLNLNNYKIFNNNYIFITTIDFINENEYISLLKEYEDMQEKYKVTFTKVYIYLYGNTLIEFNLINYNYKIKEFLNFEVFNFVTMANEISENKSNHIT